MTMRMIFHIDAGSCFASVEEVLNPSLKRNPPLSRETGLSLFSNLIKYYIKKTMINAEGK